MSEESARMRERARSQLHLVAEAGDTSAFFETLSHDVVYRTTAGVAPQNGAIVMGNTAGDREMKTAACYIEHNRLGVGRRPTRREDVILDVEGRVTSKGGLVACPAAEDMAPSQHVPSRPRAYLSPSALTLHRTDTPHDESSRDARGAHSDVVLDSRGAARARTHLSTAPLGRTRLGALASDADTAAAGSCTSAVVTELGHVDEPVAVSSAFEEDEEEDAESSALMRPLVVTMRSVSDAEGGKERLLDRDLDLVNKGQVMSIGDETYVVNSKELLPGEDDTTFRRARRRERVGYGCSSCRSRPSEADGRPRSPPSPTSRKWSWTPL